MSVSEALKPLLESGLVNEETRESIQTAWNNKLKEVQSEVRAEIREEFAGRYEHDKKVMVKALDKMVAETLTSEVAKIKEERNTVAKLKLATLKEMKAASTKFNKFMTRALAEELAEFAKERKVQTNHIKKLEKFVMSSLAEEINEFADDKKQLRESRVKLITEAKKELNSLKKKFIARSGKAVSEIVSKTLNHELSQLHEDIKIARKNNFGRKIFEAFASEFTNSYLNENAETKSLKSTIKKFEKRLAEAKRVINHKNSVLESVKKDVKKLQDRTQREKIVSELLSPLAIDKKNVMGQLLESVQTSQLRAAFDKYLPAVLNNKDVSNRMVNKTLLHESTGDKNVNRVVKEDVPLNDLKKLAGLK